MSILNISGIKERKIPFNRSGFNSNSIIKREEKKYILKLLKNIILSKLNDIIQLYRERYWKIITIENGGIDLWKK